MNPFFNAMGGGSRQPNMMQQFQQFMQQKMCIRDRAWEAWKASLPPDLEPEPTQLDRVEAQATYTAMMTDTLLEG